VVGGEVRGGGQLLRLRKEHVAYECRNIHVDTVWRGDAGKGEHGVSVKRIDCVRCGVVAAAWRVFGVSVLQELDSDVVLMIAIVDGRGVGAGKSYFTATWVIAHLSKGGTVFLGSSFGLDVEAVKKLIARRHGVAVEDDQIRFFSREQAAELHKHTAGGTEDNPVLIVLDEAQDQLNARDWGDKSKREFFQWLCQSRHDNNDVLFVTQNRHNIDKQIARLASNVYCVRNMANFKVLGLGKWPIKQFLVNVMDGDGRTLQERIWLRHDKGVFGAYRSKSMAGTHKRAGLLIPKKKLAAAKGAGDRRRMFIKLSVILLVLGVAGWKAYDHFSSKWLPKTKAIAVQAGVAHEGLFGKGGPSSGAGAAAPVTPGLVAAAPAVPVTPFDTRTEVFRGYVFGEVRTDQGEYEVGRACASGLVRRFDGRSIVVAQANGRTLVILLKGGMSARDLAPVPQGRRLLAFRASAHVR